MLGLSSIAKRVSSMMKKYLPFDVRITIFVASHLAWEAFFLFYNLLDPQCNVYIFERAVNCSVAAVPCMLVCPYARYCSRCGVVHYFASLWDHSSNIGKMAAQQQSNTAKDMTQALSYIYTNSRSTASGGPYW